MLNAINKTIRSTTRLMAVVAGIAMIAIACITMLEVGMRAVGHPLVGGIEMVSISFVISVFFAFAYVTVTEREIRVDVFRHLMPGMALRIVDSASSLITLVFFAFFVWFSVGRLVEAWERGIFLEGRLLLPMWIPWGTIVVGSFMAALASFCELVTHIASPPRIANPHEISAATRQVS